MHSTRPSAGGLPVCRRPITNASRQRAITPAPRYQYATSTTSTLWELTTTLTAASTQRTTAVTAECSTRLRVTWAQAEAPSYDAKGGYRCDQRSEARADRQVQVRCCCE